MERRFLLASVGTLTVGLAGCSDLRGGDESPTTDTPSRTDRYLPEETAEWTRDGVEDRSWSHLGADGGVRARYSGADGIEYDVIVMLGHEFAAGNARQLHCAGWQTVLLFEEDGVVVTASTGTPDRDQTPTPEAPPTIDRTPVPSSDRQVQELLLAAPAIAQEHLETKSMSSEC